MSSTSTAAKKSTRKSRKQPHSVEFYLVEVVPGPQSATYKDGPQVVYGSIKRKEAEHWRDSYNTGWDPAMGHAYVHCVETEQRSVNTSPGFVANSEPGRRFRAICGKWSPSLSLDRSESFEARRRRVDKAWDSYTPPKSLLDIPPATWFNTEDEELMPVTSREEAVAESAKNNREQLLRGNFDTGSDWWVVIELVGEPGYSTFMCAGMCPGERSISPTEDRMESFSTVVVKPTKTEVAKYGDPAFVAAQTKPEAMEAVKGGAA